MSDEAPDYGSSLVWSTEAKGKVQALLNRNGGDVNKALKALFGGSTDYYTARRLSAALADLLGLTEGQFMWKYYAWRRGEL